MVGWDDNYSKDNFRYKPANNGAWLVKGSWGADQDNDGFYWVSYDEAEFGQFCCYDFEESCDNTYHYSKMTGYVVNASNDGSVYGANVFTAKADEKLDKAGFMYVGKTGSADYTLSVYTNVSDSDPIGVLETQISGSVSANGFYTVDFPEDILLEEGEKYSISVKFSGDSGRGYLLAESDRTSKVQSGQSYVSLNGKYWSDVGADKTDSIGSLLSTLTLMILQSPIKVHLKPPLRSTAPLQAVKGKQTTPEWCLQTRTLLKMISQTHKSSLSPPQKNRTKPLL